MSTRAMLYEKNLLKSHALSVPVVSVGNLTMGGTGKTPMVAMLAKQLREKGYSPAIVSRGYGGKASGAVNVVSDGHQILLTVTEAGDEPMMLATMLPQVPVLTGKKRIHPCRFAEEELGADIIILDDGFQHLGVKRDVNIALFNATTLAGNSRVFPGGDLREPVKALNRADVFVLTGVNEANEQRARSFQELLGQKFPDIPVCFTRNNPPRIFGVDSGSDIAPSDLPAPFLAFSGIAHPSRFFDTLAGLSLSPADTIVFKDHVRYSTREQRKIQESAAAADAQALVTTLKDMVKLTGGDFEIPLYHIELETEPAPPLLKFIFDKIGLSDSQEKP